LCPAAAHSRAAGEQHEGQDHGRHAHTSSTPVPDIGFRAVSASDGMEHLRLALDRTERYLERLRWIAANDSDFDPIRDEPEFHELIGPTPGGSGPAGLPAVA